MEKRRTLSEKSAANFIGLSVSTLRKARMTGSRVGRCPVPVHVKIGRRVVYRVEDLERFLSENVVGGISHSIPNKGVQS